MNRNRIVMVALGSALALTWSAGARAQVATIEFGPASFLPVPVDPWASAVAAVLLALSAAAFLRRRAGPGALMLVAGIVACAAMLRIDTATAVHPHLDLTVSPAVSEELRYNACGGRVSLPAIAQAGLLITAIKVTQGASTAPWSVDPSSSCRVGMRLAAHEQCNVVLAPQPSQQTCQPVAVSLIGLNDLHGNLLPPGGSVTVADPAVPPPGGTRVSAGGLAFMATLIKNLRTQNPGGTLVVGAGDMTGNSPFVSASFHEESTVEALNLLGLDLTVVGPQEFQYGPAELRRLKNGGCFPPSADGLRGLVGFDTCMTNGQFAGAPYEYLSANVIDQATGNTLFPPYAVRRVGGVDIAFIGVTLKDTAALVPAPGAANLAFADEVATVNALVPGLKAKGVSSIVVLLHQGGRTTATVVNDQTCPGLSGAVVALVDAFDPAVDAVISGYTHQEYVCTRPNGRLLTQAGFFGRLVTKVDLVVDPVTRGVLTKGANNLVVVNDGVIRDPSGNPIPLPVGVSALAKDPAMDALVQSYVNRTGPISNQVIGNVTGPLTRTANAAGESQMGDLVADIYMRASTGPTFGAGAAQFAVTNPGGIRANLAGGPVTFGALFSVIPFGNYLVTMDLTGAQIRRLLEQQWEAPQPAGGRVLQVSSEFTYTWDANQPAGAAPGTGQRVVANSMKLNGVTLVPAQTYRVTVNNFMASGGDNFTVLTQGAAAQNGAVDIDAGFAYFRVLVNVPVPGQNRIARIN